LRRLQSEKRSKSLPSATRLTTACTRPPTRWISCSSKDAGRRVMPGVRLLSFVGKDVNTRHHLSLTLGYRGRDLFRRAGDTHRVMGCHGMLSLEPRRNPRYLSSRYSQASTESPSHRCANGRTIFRAPFLLPIHAGRMGERSPQTFSQR
jgi:hypothetical protein